MAENKKPLNKKQQAEAEKQKRTAIVMIIIGAVVALAIIAGILIQSCQDSKKAKSHVFADIKIRDYGTITVELDPSEAPVTVENFVKLAEAGFYNGVTFHRIMKDFMMQGGDPTGTGGGGSGENIIGEFAANGHVNNLSHTRGAISMARNSYSMDSASSQFFIVQKDSPHLDGQYACFGYVTEGMDVVDAVCNEAQPIDNNGTIAADQQPVIESVEIRRTTD